MAYSNAIPQPTDRLKDSQQDILDNFAALKTLIDVNHGTFGAADEGKHKFVTMPEQGSAPTTAVNEMALYTQLSSLSGNSELVIRNENNGASVEFTSSVKATNGWSRLPSGVLIKWGTASANRNTLSTITFPTGGTIPAFTAIYSVTGNQTFAAGPSTGDLNTAACIGNFTTTNFQVYARANGLPNSGAISIAYVAIGI